MNTARYTGEWKRAGQGICGWVRCEGEPPWLELVVDDCAVGIGRADLPDEQGYGFWIPLPPVVLEEGGIIRVRIANTPECIGRPLCLDKVSSARALQGELWWDGGLSLSGWVMDSLDPKKKVRITAVLSGESLAETLADARRYTPILGDGHGFTLHLPAQLADGETHLIRVQDSESRPLPGSPLSVRIVPEGLSSWLEWQKSLDGSRRALLTDMIRRMEVHIPKAEGLTDYKLWKAAFPVPKISGKQKTAIGIITSIGSEKLAVKQLRGQEGGIWHFAESANPEWTLLLQAGEHPS